MQMILSSLLEEINVSELRRLLIWKEAMEKKGLRVNAEKRKVMICGPIPMGCLSYRSRQQEYLLQWLQTFGCIRNAAGYND